MSWGFFLDLNLTLPTDEWTRLAQTKLGDHAIESAWWGFREDALGDMFSRPDFDDMTIGDVVAMFAREESIGTVTNEGEETTIRLAQLVDRGSDTGIAKVAAALVEASQESGRGILRMINDTTYSGEDGVEIEAKGGNLARKPLKNAQKYAAKVGAEIYGGALGEDEDEGEVFDEDEDEGDEEEAPPAKKPAKKAAAKKPAKKKPAKKAAKKPAKKAAKPAKKVAKPATKAAKTAAKTAAKKPAKTAAKTAAKKPAKKASAKKKPAKKTKKR